MNDNNDFLNSYKKSLGNDQVAEERSAGKRTRPSSDEPTTSMSFEERPTIERRGPAYTRTTPRRSAGSDRSKIMVIAILAVVLVIMLGVMLLSSVMGNVKILDFSGWTKNDFNLWASENEIMPQYEVQYSDTVEVDRIISQHPVSGGTVKKKSFVKVIVSKGPDLSQELDLPDLMSMTHTQIEAWATKNLMTKVRITTDFSDTVQTGYVIEYQINDNTVVDKVKRDTPIYVVVSKGAQQAQQKDIKIPDFKTMSISEAVIFAQDNGLNITIEEKYDDYVPANSIISQSLEKDAIAHPGDPLKIVVSLGKIRTMPSFKNLSKEDAMSRAGQLDIPVKISERYSSSSKGRMIYQSIEEGTVVTDDMKLELKYSLGSQIAVGNYIGQQKFAIEEWLKSENEYGARLKITTTYTQNEQPAGIILQQSIKDAYVYRDTVINIVVSSGNRVFVPDFVAPDGAGYDTAINREKAEAMADAVNIILIFVSETNHTRLPGEVWYQSVAAGSEVKEGATITLKYNPVNMTVLVPDFNGKTEAEVRAMAEFNQLTVEFIVGTEPQSTPNVVYIQSIAPNTTVAYGSHILLTMSPE